MSVVVLVYLLTLVFLVLKRYVWGLGYRVQRLQLVIWLG